jgi:hypothetical protein
MSDKYCNGSDQSNIIISLKFASKNHGKYLFGSLILLMKFLKGVHNEQSDRCSYK